MRSGEVGKNELSCKNSKYLLHFFPYRCAGEIAAVPNTYCAVGVAYGAKVSGKDFSCELTYKTFSSYWAGFL